MKNGAYKESDGVVRWYKDGVLHRVDGPAIIEPNGREFWYKNGLLHREDAPAIVSPDGREYWYLNGKLHRDAGPAVLLSDGTEEWYMNGVHHRSDGPAVIKHSKKLLQWFYCGVKYSNVKEFAKVTKWKEVQLVEFYLKNDYKDL